MSLLYWLSETESTNREIIIYVVAFIVISICAYVGKEP